MPVMWPVPMLGRPTVTIPQPRQPTESGQACDYLAECPGCGALAVFTTRRLPTKQGYEQVRTDVQCDCKELL